MEKEQLIENIERMFFQALNDVERYEYWCRWVLLYYDQILQKFYFFDRPRMYDTMDTALWEQNFDEVDRLVQSLKNEMV